MKKMFKCESGILFSLDDCIMVSVLRPNEVRILFDDEGVAYYAKAYIVDRQNASPACYNIVRKDYDLLAEMRIKEMFKCGNGDLFSLCACISKSELRPELVQEEGVTHYAKLYISDVQKICMVQCNITREDYDRLSKVYTDPILGNRI